MSQMKFENENNNKLHWRAPCLEKNRSVKTSTGYLAFCKQNLKYYAREKKTIPPVLTINWSMRTNL